MRDNLPSGTVTFLFSDVEGSRRLLNGLSDRCAEALAKHRGLLREAFAAHGGSELDTQRLLRRLRESDGRRRRSVGGILKRVLKAGRRGFVEQDETFLTTAKRGSSDPEVALDAVEETLDLILGPTA